MPQNEMQSFDKRSIKIPFREKDMNCFSGSKFNSTYFSDESKQTPISSMKHLAQARYSTQTQLMSQSKSQANLPQDLKLETLGNVLTDQMSIIEDLEHKLKEAKRRKNIQSSLEKHKASVQTEFLTIQ